MIAKGARIRYQGRSTLLPGVDQVVNEGLHIAGRRARRVVLTEAGQARLCELERRFRSAEQHLLDPLDEGERTVLRDLLQRLATHTGLPAAGACQVAEELASADRPLRP